jgi:hypothetical protein
MYMRASWQSLTCCAMCLPQCVDCCWVFMPCLSNNTAPAIWCSWANKLPHSLPPRPMNRGHFLCTACHTLHTTELWCHASIWGTLVVMAPSAVCLTRPGLGRDTPQQTGIAYYELQQSTVLCKSCFRCACLFLSNSWGGNSTIHGCTCVVGLRAELDKICKSLQSATNQHLDSKGIF